MVEWVPGLSCSINRQKRHCDHVMRFVSACIIVVVADSTALATGNPVTGLRLFVVISFYCGGRLIVLCDAVCSTCRGVMSYRVSPFTAI